MSDGHGEGTDQSPPSGGEMLGQLLAGLIGFAVVAVGSLGAAKMVSGAPSGSPISVGEGHFEFIAGLALLAVIVFGGIFALGVFYWVTWKLTEACTTLLKRMIWGESNE